MRYALQLAVFCFLVSVLACIVGAPSAFAQQAGYTVAFSDTTLTLGEPVVVNWSVPDGERKSRAWVGIFPVNGTDRQYVAWKYIPISEIAGAFAFTVSKAGAYEARIFNTSGYTRAGVSAQTLTITGAVTPDDPDDPDPNTGDYELTLTKTTIERGESISVSYAVPANATHSRDWVGLYVVGSSDRSYKAWRYIGSSGSGTLTFTPNTTGTYEFRYFKNNGFTKVATSPQLTVTDGDVGGGGGQCTITTLTDVTNYPPENGPVVAFGDSLTAGVGATNGQDYVSQLAQKAGVTILNEGVSGDTTEEALARLQADVLARNPSVVIVWLGGNDIIGRFYERVEDGLEDVSTFDWLKLVALKLTGKIPDTSGITEDETFANLTEIIERIQATGAITIVIGFSGGVFDDDLEDRYEAVAETTGSLYVPDALKGILGRPSRLSDLVHPNNTGYGLVADRVLPILACVI